jgi:DNA invertase Pin-like site-specific DNA recombinase
VRQLEHARSFAASKGWTVPKAYEYVDDGISGAEFETRPGFLRLMNALKPRAPFQALIMSEVSRLGREQVATAYALKQLSIAGVRCFSYLDGRELLMESATDKFLLGAVTFAADLEREKARQRTYDAMIRKARAGHVTGGKTFGYDNVDVKDPDGRKSHVERRINTDEAAVVREIFQAYANGAGVRTLARRLNDAGRPSPRAQQGRPNGWTASTVWAVLRRPLYRGELVWNQTKKRNSWGAKAQTDREEREWIRVPAPDLRIVPEDLAAAAAARASDTRAAYLRTTKGATWGRPLNAVESRYLLTGLTQCANCGASMTVRSRSHGHHRSYWYACCGFHLRGRAVCANSLEVRIEQADETILADLEQFVLHPQVVSRAVELALDELRPVAGSAERERSRLDKERRTVTREIENLTRAVALGGDLRSLISALRQAEVRQAKMDAALRAIDEPSIVTPRSAKELKTQVLAKVSAWRTELRQDAAAARRVLRRLIANRIKLQPVQQGDRRVYRYSGTFTIGGLFEGTMCPKLLASPRGNSSGPVMRIVQGLWSSDRRAA